MESDLNGRFGVNAFNHDFSKTSSGVDYDAEGKADRLGMFSINGHKYTAADVGILCGRVSYRKAAPYVGIGWGNALAQDSRWHANADLGAFYQGNANVQLASIGCTTSQTVCKTVASDVAALRDSFGDDLNKYKFYPVVRASLSYHFRVALLESTPRGPKLSWLMLTPTEGIMNKHPARWSVLVLACLLVAACQDKRDPVKPSVSLAAAPAGLVQT